MFGFRNRQKYNGTVDTKINNEYQIATRDNPLFPAPLAYLQLIDTPFANHASEDECALQIATLYLAGLFRHGLWDDARVLAGRIESVTSFGLQRGLIRQEVWDRCVDLIERTQREVSAKSHGL